MVEEVLREQTDKVAKFPNTQWNILGYRRTLARTSPLVVLRDKEKTVSVWAAKSLERILSACEELFVMASNHSRKASAGPARRDQKCKGFLQPRRNGDHLKATFCSFFSRRRSPSSHWKCIAQGYIQGWNRYIF